MLYKDRRFMWYVKMADGNYVADENLYDSYEDVFAKIESVYPYYSEKPNCIGVDIVDSEYEVYKQLTIPTEIYYED